MFIDVFYLCMFYRSVDHKHNYGPTRQTLAPTDPNTLYLQTTAAAGEICQKPEQKTRWLLTDMKQKHSRDHSPIRNQAPRNPSNARTWWHLAGATKTDICLPKNIFKATEQYQSRLPFIINNLKPKSWKWPIRRQDFSLSKQVTSSGRQGDFSRIRI